MTSETTPGRIVVTGASRGIGAAIAVELAARGRRIVALSRSGTAPVGQPLACDVTDEASLRAAFATVAADGGITGLINCAGVHRAAVSATLPTAAWEATMRLNATAVLVACREVYPHLRAAGGGTIVNIGSFWDRLGIAGSVAYYASKAAVGAITRCLAVEWAKDAIRVFNVAPGYIETDLNRDYLAREKVKAWIAQRVPIGRPGQPEEVARVVAALIAADTPLLAGETIYLDGGQTINQ
jgi:NAD(P)-dependent dehydrogenase (short-subunit alcohol dehydrogenase family)